MCNKSLVQRYPSERWISSSRVTGWLGRCLLVLAVSSLAGCGMFGCGGAATNGAAAGGCHAGMRF
ncbi:hypothetical protein [Burkholderia ubonensis]|uniref:hypothetical protein n=1 Tax=Burkholderia ubonensis TaxID=101571 RepID=UPI0009B4CDD6